MLALKVNGSTLDLYPGTKVNFTLVNPIVDKDQAPRLYTWPFRVPASPRNSLALGYSNRLDVRDRVQVVDNCQLFIEGELFETGKVKIVGGTEKTIELVFQRTEMALLEDLEKIDINKILETVSALGPAPSAHWIFDVTCGTPNSYAIQIGGMLFTYNALAGQTAANVVSGLSALIDAEYAGLTFTFPGQTQLKLESSKLIEYGITVNLDSLICLAFVSATTQGESRQQAFLTKVAEINEGTPTRYALPTIRWYSFYSADNPSYISYVNLWLDGETRQNTPHTEKEWEHTWVPFVLLKYIINQIQAQISDQVTDFAGTFYEREDIQSLLLFNNRSLDELEQETYEDGLKWLNRFQSTINLNQHVPEITAYELLTKFMGSFALHFRIEGKQWIFRLNREQITQQPIDWTTRAEPEYSAEFNTESGFIIKYDPNSSEGYEDNTQLEDLQVGDGETEIVLPFSTLNMKGDELSDSFFTSWKVPIVNMPGSSPVDGFGENPFGFRLFFYRGLQLDSEGSEYPFGQHDTTNYQGTEIAELSLALEGEKGLYNQCFKGYLELLQAPVVTKLLRLGIEDLIEIRTWQNSRRKIFHQQGEMVGVIRSVQFQVSDQGISPSKVEFLQQT